MAARGGSLEGSWAQQDDETLLAQGRASGRGLSQGLPLLFAQVPGLEQRLRSSTARFLDVGVGVGAMACAVAEAIPSLFVVGIDPFERALEIASRHIAERGLDNRVTLRGCGVEDITDEDAFDLAWLPAPFIPSQAFTVGVFQVHRALRPGGWILVGMGRVGVP